MSKEVHLGEGVRAGLVEGLKALPDPGDGKRLIVFIRASSVRLHVVDDPSTIEEPEGEAGGAPE